jgi:hypothetical protein
LAQQIINNLGGLVRVISSELVNDNLAPEVKRTAAVILAGVSGSAQQQLQIACHPLGDEEKRLLFELLNSQQ